MNAHQSMFSRPAGMDSPSQQTNQERRRRRRGRSRRRRQQQQATTLSWTCGGTTTITPGIATILHLIWVVSWIAMTILLCEGLAQRQSPSCRTRSTPTRWMTEGDVNDDTTDGDNQTPSTSTELSPSSLSGTSRETLQREQKATIPDPFAASRGGDFSPTTQQQQHTQQPEPIRTLKGGPALIFELARRSIMFVHDFDDTSVSTPQTAQPAIMARKRRRALPRWHPHDGISDANPAFRKQAPAMNNQGFAKSIWRNARKRNKPQLWRQALRTYDRMTVIEQDPEYQQKLKIQRTNTHHEGAMVACAKLGLWQRALEIYHSVWQQEQAGQALLTQQAQKQQQPAYGKATSFSSSSVTTLSGVTNNGGRGTSASGKTRMKQKRVYVTDNMILSLVKACVRASRSRSKNKSSRNQNGKAAKATDESSDEPTGPAKQIANGLSETLDAEAALRRIPLDTAQQVLSTMQEEHSVPLVAYFVNPLAAAYQSLGYFQEARYVLQTMLSNRTVSEEPEIGADLLNIHDLWAKDMGSYSLIVQGNLATGDYGAAVEALQDMTNAGLFPDQKHTAVWSEISERRTRPRFVGSRKKKRDDYWTDNIL